MGREELGAICSGGRSIRLLERRLLREEDHCNNFTTIKIYGEVRLQILIFENCREFEKFTFYRENIRVLTGIRCERKQGSYRNTASLHLLRNCHNNRDCEAFLASCSKCARLACAASLFPDSEAGQLTFQFPEKTYITVYSIRSIYKDDILALNVVYLVQCGLQTTRFIDLVN